MAKDTVTAVVKLQILAGQATPAPPVGTALGPHGVAIMDFCKDYNDRTKDKQGQIIPVEITIYEDRSFSFITKTPTLFVPNSQSRWFGQSRYQPRPSTGWQYYRCSAHRDRPGEDARPQHR